MKEHARTREPWLAANLSAMVPGLGQLYAGRRLAAGLFFLGWGACAAAALWLLLAPEGSVPAGLAALAAALVVFLVNVAQAHSGARRANPPSFEAERRREKDPWLAVLLTVILPGLGHVYLGRWLAAGLLLALQAGFAWLVWRAGPAHAANVHAYPFFLGAAAYAACAAAPARRRSLRAGAAYAIAITFLVLARNLAAVLLPASFPEVVAAGDDSMAPAIEQGDRVLAWKRPGTLRRGDVILYAPGGGSGTGALGRICGWSGEKLELENGKLRVDGKELEEEPWRSIRHPAAGKAEESGEVTVAAGRFFVLGDDSTALAEGRTITESDVRGRITKILLPLRRAGAVH